MVLLRFLAASVVVPVMVLRWFRGGTAVVPSWFYVVPSWFYVVPSWFYVVPPWFRSGSDVALEWFRDGSSEVLEWISNGFTVVPR